MLDVFMSSVHLVCIAMLLLWVLASVIRNNSIVDIFWGIGFILIAFNAYLQGPAGEKQFLAVLLTTLWGTRLALHIAVRNHGKGEDKRYAKWRKDWGESVILRALVQVFLLQGFIMLLVSLPIIAVQSSSITSLSPMNKLGVLLWIFGFLCESIADAHLAQFKSNPKNKGKVLSTGLWKYSRHPNYFGESCVWWGMWLVSIGQYSLLSLISPVLITFFLLKVSGVTLLEKSFSGSSEYDLYKQRTSAFVLWPPKK